MIQTRLRRSHACSPTFASWSVCLLIGVLLLAACSTQSATPPAAVTKTLPSLSATLPATGAGTSLPPKSQGKLSSRLQILSDPQINAQDNAAQARALGLPESGPGSLVRNDKGEILVAVRASDVAQTSLDALAAAGFTSTNVAESFKTVTGYVAPSQLTALAALPIVENIQEELAP